LEINTLYREAKFGGKAAEEKLFRALLVRFRLFVFRRILNEEDAEETVQEALLAVAEHMHNIDFTVSFSAWAYNVLINRIHGYYRKKNRQVSTSDNLQEIDSLKEDWTPDPLLIPKLLGCLKKVARSNRRYARILVLKFQGYDAQEICRKLNLSANNLYVILSRARSLLKECMEKEGIRQ